MFIVPDFQVVVPINDNLKKKNLDTQHQLVDTVYLWPFEIGFAHFFLMGMHVN